MVGVLHRGNGDNLLWTRREKNSTVALLRWIGQWEDGRMESLTKIQLDYHLREFCLA